MTIVVKNLIYRLAASHGGSRDVMAKKTKNLSVLAKYFFASYFLLVSISCADICVVNLETGKKTTVSRWSQYREEICYADYRSGDYSYLIQKGKGFVLKNGNVGSTRNESFNLAIPVQSLRYYWGGSKWHYALSPDRQQLAYYDDSNRKIMIIKCEKNAQPIAIGNSGMEDFVPLRFFEWKNSNELLLGIDSRIEGLRGVYSIDTDKKQNVAVYEINGVSYGCKISYNHGLIAFKVNHIPEEYLIIIYDLYKNQERKRLSVSSLTARPITWSVTKSVLFYKDNDVLYSFDTINNDKVQICKINPRIHILDFDGKTLVYKYFTGTTRKEIDRASRLFVQDVETGIEREIKGVNPHGKCFLLNNSKFLLVNNL